MSNEVYDTIKLRLRASDVSEVSLLDVVCKNVELEREGRNMFTDTYYQSGTIKNMRVYATDYSLSLEGSLSSYWFDDPSKTLTLLDTEKAMYDLSHKVGLDITQSTATRIDIAGTFTLNYKPEAYYHHLGSARYFQRLKQEKSVYFRNQQRELLFYNKIAELKAKGIDVPPRWYHTNVMRYEMRFKKPKSNFKRMVYGYDLYENDFFNTALNEWYNNYTKVNKVDLFKCDLKSIKKPRGLIEFFAASFIDNQGGTVKALEFVEQLRDIDAFQNPAYYSRAKKMIKELSVQHHGKLNTDLIAELDSKILAIYEANKV